jgi:hypothetical protein
MDQNHKSEKPVITTVGQPGCECTHKLLIFPSSPAVPDILSEKLAYCQGSQVTLKMQNWLYRYMAIIENSCIADFSLTSFTKITMADLFFTV